MTSIATSAITYDFTLYTNNPPHNRLNNLMKELINYYLKGGETKLAVTKLNATWADDKNKFKTSSLKLTINFLLDNCFY